MNRYLHWVATCSLIILQLADLTVQISTDEYFTLTPSQRIKLDEFRDRVNYRVPHDYMTEDIYLIRWLRDRKFNVDDAEKRLLNHLSWREENDMDKILDEDWNDYDHEYRMSVQGCNKYGHPILSVRAGDWDMRRAVLTGKSRRMMRFVDKLFEEALQMQQRMYDDGQNTTQFVFILNNDNVNMVQHLCPRCIPIYLYWLSTLVWHYPGVAHKAFLVNTPQFFLPIWDLYKHFIPSQYIEILGIYGMDKAKWSGILMKDTDKDQLSKIYGGVNSEAIDIQDYRATGKTYKCTNIE